METKEFHETTKRFTVVMTPEETIEMIASHLKAKGVLVSNDFRWYNNYTKKSTGLRVVFEEKTDHLKQKENEK